MPDTRKIKCKYCGKEVEVPSDSRTPFCSEECQRKHKLELRKLRKASRSQKQGIEEKKEETKELSKEVKQEKPKTKKKVSSKNKKSESKVIEEAKDKLVEASFMANLENVDLDSLFPPEIWEQRPVDIYTFLFDRMYLGNAWLDSDGNRTMFPFWQEEAGKMFPLPMRSPFNIIIFAGSTGQGKTSVMMGVCFAYYLHIVLCLRDPHKYFKLADQKDIVFATINIVTKTMAYKNAWGMIHKMLINSPWFMARGAKTKKSRPEWYCTTKPVSLIYGRNADDLIGLDILVAALDEISFARNQSVERQIELATAVFNAAWERMKSRYLKFGGIFEGLMLMASSKRTDQSFLESFTKKLMEGVDSKLVYVIDRARWEVLPPETYSGAKFPIAVGDKFRPSQIISESEVEQYSQAEYEIIWSPVEYLQEFQRDMNVALTNIAGKSVGQISSFLPGNIIKNCIGKNPRPNIFTKSVIFSGYKDDDQYYDYVDLDKCQPDDFTLPLFVHLDASLGGDGNSISGVLADYALNQRNVEGSYSEELHYRQLFKIKVRAPQGTHTGLRKNTEFIYWLNKHFNLKGVQHDQYQSAEFHQALDRSGIPVYQESIDRVTNGINQPYSVLRNVIYDERIDLLDDKDQTNELVSLEKYESGKIDKPLGGNDDASQCLAGAVYLASKAKDEILASGAVLLKQLDSSQSFDKTKADPDQIVAKELEQHFAVYSPEAKVVNQVTGKRDEWDKFFGKDKKEEEKKKEFNITSCWG